MGIKSNQRRPVITGDISEESIFDQSPDDSDESDIEEDQDSGHEDTDEGIDDATDGPDDESDGPDGDSDTEDTDEDTSEEDSDTVSVTLGGKEITESEDADASAPAWVRQLRKEHRELKRRNRELEEKLKVPEQTKVEALPPRPKLEDFDYDQDEFDKAVDQWIEKKKTHDARQEEAQKAQKKAQEAWQERLQTYEKKKKELRLRDYEDAEGNVREAFNTTQQGIIVQGLDNPALVVYALGKDPKRRAELAAITDPVRFAVAVAKLETQLKITPRKSPPPPAKTVNGSAPKSGTVDSQLERLRAEAEKTGNYSKVVAYKRAKQQSK